MCDKRYFDIRVILPARNTCMKQEWKIKWNTWPIFMADLGFKNCYVGIMRMQYDGIQFTLLTMNIISAVPKPYNSVGSGKICIFLKAVLSVLPVIISPGCDPLSDWQTGLVPVSSWFFPAEWIFQRDHTVMTIHNLKFGSMDVKTVREITGLSDYYFAPR